MEQLIEQEQEEYFEAQELRYEETKAEVDDLESEYIMAKMANDTTKKTMAEVKERLEQLYSQGIQPRKLTRTEATRKGNVDMKELQRKYDLMDSDIDTCRKAEIEIITYKVVK